MMTRLRGRGRRSCRKRASAALAAGLIVGVAGFGLASVPASAAVRLRPRSVGAAVAARTGGKLSPRLSALAARSFASPRAEAAALSLPASGPGSLVRKPGGRVLVEIRTSASTSSAVVSKLRDLGAGIVNVSPRYSVVTASVAPSALDAIANDAAVSYVTEVLAPLTAAVGSGTKARTNASGACTPTISDGDALMNVAGARAADAVDGTGQTIGVIFDSFDTAPSAPTRAADDVASGNLPGPGNPCGETTPVTVQSDYSGGGQTDEGRAMAELAHGLAPGARLAFATASNGEFDFASQINNLRTVNHASVIVDDTTYFDEPFFQDGPVAVAANAASAAGVPYFSSAGNSNIIVGGKNVSSYETPSFRSMACPAVVSALEPLTGCHNFDTTGGSDNSDDVTLAPGGGFGLDLQWAQPWGAVTNDYDVFLLNAAGTSVLADSAVDQSKLKEPFEFFGYTNSTTSDQTVQIVIAKFSGSTDSRMKFVMVGAGGIRAVQYDTSAGGDIVGPTIFGHNGAATVGSTGAIRYSDSSTPEDFSSRGPVTLYYQPVPSTAPLASPEVLDKPDFVATDDVENVFFGDPAGNGFRFAGTSAASPQAAAIGALLRDYDPGITPGQVMATLRSTARAVPTNGTASDVGGGYIDATAALASVAPLPGAAAGVTDTNGNARATVRWSPAPASPKFAVTGYVVTPIRAGVPQAAHTFNSAATSEVITGLTNGRSYTFTVTAVNANGAGPPSAPSFPMVIGQAGPPGAVFAVPANAGATVKWAKPTVTNGLPIVGYNVYVYSSRPAGSSLVSKRVFSGTATSHTVGGLTNGSAYAFVVSAINSGSSGIPSSTSAPLIAGAPGLPTAVSATGAHKSAKVHWVAPPANGKPVTSYTVTPFIGSVAKAPVAFHSAATTETVPGLITGQHYTFRVTATNTRGVGPKSTASNAVKIS